MLPTRAEAEKLVTEAELCNPGPWGDHCRVAAHCAEKIAQRCGMDGEKAYVLGLLHDIGRKFGTRHMGHVVDGYRYMLALGYDEVARICLYSSLRCSSPTIFSKKSLPAPQPTTRSAEILLPLRRRIPFASPFSTRTLSTMAP